MIEKLVRTAETATPAPWYRVRQGADFSIGHGSFSPSILVEDEGDAQFIETWRNAAPLILALLAAAQTWHDDVQGRPSTELDLLDAFAALRSAK
jgi:hypothetical protein